jgi:hypothetical protein
MLITLIWSLSIIYLNQYLTLCLINTEDYYVYKKCEVNKRTWQAGPGLSLVDLGDSHTSKHCFGWLPGSMGGLCCFDDEVVGDPWRLGPSEERHCLSDFICLSICLSNETGFCYAAQAGLELGIFLSQPPEYWDYRCSVSCPACLCMLTYHWL